MSLSSPLDAAENAVGGEYRLVPGLPRIAAFVTGFFGLWMAAWLGHRQLDGPLRLSARPGRDLSYWVAAKALVWLLYPVLYWRDVAGRLVLVGFGRTALRRGLGWGAAAAAVWLALSAGLLVLTGSPITPGHSILSLGYVALVTPVCEELVFRGYLQGALSARDTRFVYVNCVVTLLFVLTHYIGWAFQGSLAANGFSSYPLAITALSLVLGYLRRRSDSLAASTTLHVANNLFRYLVGA